jgi:hypothetical protein
MHMDQVTAIPAGEYRLAQRVSEALPLSGRRWLVHCAWDGELLVLDERLEPLWRLQVPTGWHGTHAVADDLTLAALSLRDHVLLVDRTGRQVARFPHHPWGNSDSETGCCVFAADGRHLWATVPTWSPQRPWEANDELWLIDLTTLAVVDQRRLDVAAAGTTPLRHPDGHTIGLSIGEGQDGSYIRWAHADEGRITLRTAPTNDRTLVGVHPAGQEYLTSPHSKGTDELRRHRFADDQPIDRLPAPDQGVGDSWDYTAGYLTEELILAHLYESDEDVLVRRRPLQPIATVVYPCGAWLGRWSATGTGEWLTIGPQGIQRWRLPTPLSAPPWPWSQPALPGLG